LSNKKNKNPKIIIKLVKKILKSDNQNLRKKAKTILINGKNPISKLLTTIRTIKIFKYKQPSEIHPELKQYTE